MNDLQLRLCVECHWDLISLGENSCSDLIRATSAFTQLNVTLVQIP
ncbi:hypothetical protein BH18ACI1_BH18ACI1_01370 [soil metagenome]